jgi:4-hydroxybenzoate polyprenyltransferase
VSTALAGRQAVIAVLRPDQWVKNVFVVAPLFFTPAALTPGNVGRVALALVCFCLLASAVYVQNDYADREADRLHSVKRNRPIASGALGAQGALALLIVLLLLGGALAVLLGRSFLVVAAVYILLNFAYSLGLKRIAVLDVMIVAAGFVLRVEGGSRVIHVEPSAWIVIATGLLALFLALAKRRDDLTRNLASNHRASLAGYNRPFLDAAVVMTLSGLLVAYLIYTTDSTVMLRLGTTQLYYTAPFVVAGILRYLQITLVEERSGSPTSIALRDRFIICAVLGWIVTFALLIYG